MPHLVNKEPKDKDFWTFAQKAELVYNHYAMMYEEGVRFIGDNIFTSGNWRRIYEWTVPEIKRIYEMMKLYEKKMAEESMEM